ACGSESIELEIIARSVAGQVATRAEVSAQLEQAPIAVVVADAEFGGTIAWSRDAKFCGQPINEREVEVDQTTPRSLEDFLQPRQESFNKRSARIELADSRQMFAPPVAPVVDLDIENRLAGTTAVKHWNREPDNPLRPLHAVAVAPAVLVELHVVVVHE